MNETEQRIAIAEIYGWKKRNVVAPCGDDCGYFWSLDDDPQGKFIGSSASTDNELPNYPQDLNAMYEARKILTKEQQKTYCEILEVVIGNSMTEAECDLLSGDEICWKFIQSTSQQQAETFLKTFNRWKD